MMSEMSSFVVGPCSISMTPKLARRICILYSRLSAHSSIVKVIHSKVMNYVN